MLLHRRLALLLMFITLAIGGLFATSGRVEAHAFLERSDPEANAVLPEQVAEVRLWFTEPLEANFSSADLYNAEGAAVTSGASRIGDEDNLLILELPPLDGVGALRQIGRQLQVGVDFEVEFGVRIAPRDLARDALEVKRALLVEAAPSMVSPREWNRRAGQGDQQESALQHGVGQ